MTKFTKRVCLLLLFTCLLLLVRFHLMVHVPQELIQKLSLTGLQYDTSNSSVVTETESPSRDWKEGTFCHDFLVNTFQQDISICSDTPLSRSSVNCFGNPQSRHMAACVMENIIVSPQLLKTALSDADYPSYEAGVYPIGLLDGVETKCVNMTTNQLRKHVESGDYVLEVMHRIHHEKRNETFECEQWINETVLFFTAHRFHIYFRLLDYFNVHKLLEDFRYTLTDHYRIVRISGRDNYHFPEFDQALFPGVKVQSLDDFKEVKMCFKKVVLVPKSYASVIFQCKMQISLRDKCMHCDGKGLSETQINRFKDRMMKACSLTESSQITRNTNTSVILVSRTPYLRNEKDKITNFERMLGNEDTLVRELRKHFKNSVVKIVHLENMTLCEQVSHGNSADVYIGVHGSGLVHLWWMRDDALVYELEPHFEIGNPTFRMLSRLSGRNYHSDFVGGGWRTVRVDINGVINSLKKHSKLQYTQDQ